MKLGLLTDVHAHVYHLLSALERLQLERVDEIVVIGDVIDLFARFAGIDETCRLLADAKAIGVWATMTMDFASIQTRE
jgi:predicted phosphodiesterase